MKTQTEVIHPEILADITDIQARAIPDRVALIFEARQWTYSQFNDCCNQAANLFVSKGIKPGDRIAWLANNIVEFWFALFGAAKIGAVLTPLNWRLAAVEIKQILDDAQASLFITQTEFLQTLKSVDLPTLIAEGESENSFQVLLQNQNSDFNRVDADLDSAVLQLYTSGTTGLPKGVELSNRSFYEVAKALLSSGALTRRFENEVVLNCLPHFHIAGVGLGMAAFKQGMPVLQQRGFDAQAIIEAGQSGEPVSLFLVPAMIMMLLETAKQTGASLDHFSVVSYGAAPMPEALLQAAMSAMPNAQFNQFYGMTETTGGLTMMTHDEHGLSDKRRSAGRPLIGVQIKIIDPDTKKELAIGEVGEVVAKVDFLMQGYWNKADATTEVIQDGWYYSGDAGYFDEDGFLFVVDRIKDMIISGGENIYPAELENTLSTHPAVLECAFVGKADDKWGEVVRAFVVARQGEELSAADVMAYLGERIARFKLPREVQFLDALPRNPSGKILKTRLREM